MHGNTDEVSSALLEQAERMVQHYARGLLTVERLLGRLTQAWLSRTADEGAANCSLELLAQSLCSQVLCEACRSSEDRVRDQAFENLRDYLAEVLARTPGNAGWATADLQVEVLQRTMIEIFQSVRKERGGPENPAAFLKWSRVILWRQLAYCQRQSWRVNWLSLEAQAESILAGLIDEKSADPLDTLLRDELQTDLKRAISTLRNPQYQAVLLNTFFDGLEEQEMAALWHVRVKDIYLWRFRALQALRKQLAAADALQ